MLCAENVIWDQTEVKYCKIRLWFTSNRTCGFISKHIIWCTYNISKNSWIDTFYNILFTNEQTRSKHKMIELLDYTTVYTYYLYA